MNEPTPRRTIIGAFPSGAEIVAFAPVEATMIADAGRRLDAERTETERAAYASITVSRAWLLVALRNSIAVAERDLAAPSSAGDYSARLAAARKLNRLRRDYAFCNARAADMSDEEPIKALSGTTNRSRPTF